MDPEEDIDSAIDAALAEPPPRRMRRTVRTVLPEREVVAGREEVRERGTSETVFGDHDVDADAPIASVPAHRDEKGAASGPTPEQATEWRRRDARRDVERSDEEMSIPTPVGDVTVAPVWDAFIGADSPEASGRTLERLSGVWDQFTSGDARLGGRNPITPIVGEDLRGEAPMAALYQALPIHVRDDARRAEVEGRAARAREQAPDTAVAGDVAAGGLYALAPNPSTAVGRLGMTAGIGGAVAGAHSLDAPVEDALSGAGMATLFGLGAEGTTAALTGGGATRRAARGLEQSAARTQRAADQARLEASGVWGGRAMRAADELPGGQERLAADLRQYGVGERGPGQAGFSATPPRRGATIPMMDRAAEDAATLGRASGSQMAQMAQQIDATGELVSTLRVQSEAERLAQELDALPIGGREAAAQLRQLAAPLAEGGDLPMSTAWRQRQLLDDMITNWQRDPNLATVAGRLQTVRQQLSAEMQRTAQRAGLGSQWSIASRGSSVGQFMREYGRGGERLSVGGGMGGAQAAGDVAASAVMSGSPMQAAAAVPRQMAARAISQETRMAFPGVRARVGEASAGMQRSAAESLYALAQAQPDLPFAREIIAAGSRGTAALAATVYVLAQRDAEVRRLLEEMEDDDSSTAERAITAQE